MTTEIVNNPPTTDDLTRFAENQQFVENFVNDEAPRQIVTPGGTSRNNLAGVQQQVDDMLPLVQEAASIASASAEAAAALLNGKVFATAAAGVDPTTGVAAGMAYLVSPSSAGANGAYDLYQNVGGVSTFISTVPSFAIVQALQTMLQTMVSAGRVLTVKDGDGFIAFQVTSTGLVAPGVSLNTAGVTTPAFSLVSGSSLAPAEAAPLRLKDPEGFYTDIVLSGGQLANSGATSSVTDASTYGPRNASNLAYSQNVRGQVNSEIASLEFDYCHIAGYGQSIGNGCFGWPRMNTAAYKSNLMLGGSIFSAVDAASSFAPVGGSSTLSPLVGTVLDASGNIISDAAVASGSGPASNRGEAPLVEACNLLKKLHNRRAELDDDASRILVASYMGVNGQTIGTLGKGGSYYGKLTSHATALKAAIPSGKQLGLSAIYYGQGENDYAPASTAYAAYLAALGTMRSNIIADIATTTYGQAPTKIPGWFMHQAGGGFTSDDGVNADLLRIGQAQADFCKQNRNCYLIGGYYPYTEKTGGSFHLDPNGYRWLGTQLGKVMHRVLELRQGWQPLSPIGFTLNGNILSVDFHVPYGPLVFDKPYVSYTATDYANKGFVVVDATGSVGINNVRIVYDTIVELTLARTPSGATYCGYAPSATYAGNGCLRDSDPFVAMSSYTYSATTGQDVAANVAALVGNPYPAYNWAVAFNLKVQ